MITSLFRYNVNLINETIFDFKIVKILDKVDVFCLVYLPYLVFKKNYLEKYYEEFCNATIVADYVAKDSKFYSKFISELIFKYNEINETFEFSVPTFKIRQLTSAVYNYDEDKVELVLYTFIILSTDPHFVTRNRAEVIFTTMSFDFSAFKKARIDKIYLKIGSNFVTIKDNNLVYIKDLKQYKTMKEFTNYLIDNHIVNKIERRNAKEIIEDYYKLGIIY